MDPEGGGIMRCVRHPSQFFTGVCSSCLAERLSSIHSAEDMPSNLFCRFQTEIVEVSSNTTTTSDAQTKPRAVRLRKTLLYLFQLDDSNGSEEKEVNDDDKDRFGIKKSKPGNGNGMLKNGCIDRAGVPTSYSAAVDFNGDAHVGKKLDVLPASDNLEEETASSWLSSVFFRKASRWRMRRASKKEAMHEGSQNGDLVAEQLETNIHSRRSCDGSSFHSRSRVFWEAPRHSWDGSLMSKALPCSFACLEEREGACCGLRRGRPEETTISDGKPSTSTPDANKANGLASTSEKTRSTDGGRFHEDSQQVVSISSIIRKKSSRWCKVWDWSITSPFKDFSRKRERVLERSLSESWQDCCHKDNDMDSVETVNGNGPSFPIKNQYINRSTNVVNGDTQNLRPDSKRKKSEFRISRSRSVNYSSPGNLDSGLLRFYLTPLRSSRRVTSKGRTKTSHSFAQGIFGMS